MHLSVDYVINSSLLQELDLNDALSLLIKSLRQLQLAGLLVWWVCTRQPSHIRTVKMAVPNVALEKVCQ